MGVSTDSLQRYIREEVQPPFAAIARLCLATDMSLRWMATGIDADGETARHALSEAHLGIALEHADRAIGVGWLPRPLYARLVRLLYDGIGQGLATAQIEQFAAAAARSLAQGGGDDAAEAGIDASKPADAGD